MTRQQARKTRRVIRRASGTIAFAAFFMALGVVGGIEHDTIALLPGFGWCMGLIIAGGLFSWLSGAWN